jgi:dynein heavy chain, axonemal
MVMMTQVTNQMITTCKAYIKEGAARVWELPVEELKRRIGDSMKLNESYQQQFHKTKQKLQETPSERQFDFRYANNIGRLKRVTMINKN